MTTHPFPVDAPLRLHRPAELLAALPALLGFHPVRSLVLVCLEGERGATVGLVARVDLPPPGDPGAARSLAEQLSALCVRRATPAVVLVVVDDRVAGTAVPGRQLVRRLRRALEDVGTEVVSAHHVTATEPGAPWRSYSGPGGGRLEDPRSSPVTAAHVLAGRVVHGSRDSLAELLRSDGAQRTGEVARALVPALRAAADRPAGALLATVLAAVANTENGCAAGDPTAGPEQAATVAAALCTPLVRDCCFALAGGPDADAAEQLWTRLVRAVPGPERAEPAVLLAHACYARGDGALAGLALDLALRAHPGHRMASLLEASLQAGLSPTTVQALAVTARGLAAELGVVLPEPSWT